MRATTTSGRSGRARPTVWWAWPAVTLALAGLWLLANGAAMALEYSPLASLWFPPTAITFAGFAVFRHRAWPGLILANLAGAAFTFVRLGHEFAPERMLLYGLLYALAHCVPYWLVAQALLQSIPRNAAPSLARTVGVFLLGGVVAALIAAVAGVWVSTVAGMADRSDTWPMILPWLIGDVAGLLAFGPLTLLAFRALATRLRIPVPHRLHAFDDLPRPPRAPAAYALKLAATLGTACLALFAIGQAPQNEPLLFIVFIAIVLQLWIVHTQGTLESLVSIALFNLCIVGQVYVLGLGEHALTLQFAMITLASASYYGLAVPLLYADNAQLRRLLIHDALTGAYNRHFFVELSQQAIRQSRMREQPASMLMLDLDNLKQINDHHGHAAGDQALAQVAQACRSALSANDLLGRLGGDEFCVLLPGVDHAGAADTAQRLLLAVRASHYPFSADIRPSMSIGISTTVDDADDYESLWMRADSALYVAKRAGRDRVAQQEVADEASEAV